MSRWEYMRNVTTSGSRQSIVLIEAAVLVRPCTLSLTVL